MELPSLATSIALIAIGALISIGADWIRRLWTASSARQQRQEERAEEAGQKLLELLDELRRDFKHMREIGDEPEELDNSLGNLARLSALITDAAVRRRLQMVHEVLEDTITIAEAVGHAPWHSSRNACNAGANIVGAWLRNDPIPSTPILDKYIAAIKEAEEEFLEAERQHIESLETKSTPET